MKTLKLNKKSKGYYTNKVDSIEVIVSEFNGNWTGEIVDWNKSNDEFILHKTFASTKKIVVKELTKYFL
jgi:hypothetical protein